MTETRDTPSTSCSPPMPCMARREGLIMRPKCVANSKEISETEDPVSRRTGVVIL